MEEFLTAEGLLVSHVPYKGETPMSETVNAYPFSSITEIYEAGKTYGEKALEAIKNVVSYPYELVTEALGKEEPTGVIKSEDSLTNLFKTIIAPPWVFLLLGVAGLWAFSVFKKR